MKKIITILIATAAIASGCSSASKKLTLNTYKIFLNAEETYQLEASEETVLWAAKDSFVAEVSKSGLVTGNHIGKTNIIVSNDDKATSCDVVVTPKYNTYKEPITDWGVTPDYVRKNETRKFWKEINDDYYGLAYKGENDAVYFIAYMFENDKLICSGVVVRLSYALEASYFLLERYLPSAMDSNNYTFYFLDNFVDKAKMLIVESLNDDNAMILYQEYTRSKSESFEETIESFSSAFSEFTQKEL